MLLVVHSFSEEIPLLLHSFNREIPLDVHIFSQERPSSAQAFNQAMTSWMIDGSYLGHGMHSAKQCHWPCMRSTMYPSSLVQL